MSTIVLKTAVSDGQYTFLTQNNGHDTVKSPAGMFPSLAIENDLKYVDDKIRNYYEIGDFKSDEEMAEADASAKTDVNPEEKKSRRSRRGEKKEEEPTEAPKEETKTEEIEEKPARRSRKVDNEDAIAEERTKWVNIADALNEDKGEEIPFDEFETPPVEMPKRKRRSTEETPINEPEDETPDSIPDAEDDEDTENVVEETSAPVRRRRRRG